VDLSSGLLSGSDPRLDEQLSVESSRRSNDRSLRSNNCTRELHVSNVNGGRRWEVPEELSNVAGSYQTKASKWLRWASERASSDIDHNSCSGSNVLEGDGVDAGSEVRGLDVEDLESRVVGSDQVDGSPLVGEASRDGETSKSRRESGQLGCDQSEVDAGWGVLSWGAVGWEVGGDQVEGGREGNVTPDGTIAG